MSKLQVYKKKLCPFFFNDRTLPAPPYPTFDYNYSIRIVCIQESVTIIYSHALYIALISLYGLPIWISDNVTVRSRKTKCIELNNTYPTNRHFQGKLGCHKSRISTVYYGDSRLY